MKEHTIIPLPNSNRVVLIDAADYDIISASRWHLTRDGTGYAMCNVAINGTRSRVAMHRFICCLPKVEKIGPKTLYVDHINHDTLDNRRQNLRIINPLQNVLNRIKGKPKTHRYKGINKVYQGRLRCTWGAKIQFHGKEMWLGCFRTQEDAAQAYDEAARKYHGEFACVNFPREGEQGCLT